MKTGPVAIGLAAVLAIAAPIIILWEGVEYVPYRDPVGIVTVCYGHTGPDTVWAKKYSKAECEALLEGDMRVANAIVRKCLPAMTYAPWREAAFTSAVFNIGPKVVCGSTLQRKAKAGDWLGACAELDKWKYAKGRVFKGLVLRRADERALCESGL